MVIDLKKFFLSEGYSEDVAYDLDLTEVELGGVKPFCAPVKVQAQLKSFAGSALLRAELSYQVTMPCDRCCEITTQRFSPTFTHTLVRELSGEEDEGFVVVPEERLDLDQLLTEDILLEMPSKFLCRPDCKGICPVCGKNRNLEECSCQERETDPRLEALKSLLEDR